MSRPFPITRLDPQRLASGPDPVREAFRAVGQPVTLDAVRGLFPPITGEPAFDPVLIAGNIERLTTRPEVATGHPYLDLAVKTGLACIEATFQGDHPKYGLKHYAENRHDAFPPTIIATVDALSVWGRHERAAQLFRYWLTHFVASNGTFRYYGPSLSEYGQMLHTAALLHERAGPDGWWKDGHLALSKLAERLTDLCAQAEQAGDLIAGAPEADISTGEPNNLADTEHNDRNRYFHNNAWVVRGLMRWADLADGAAFPTAAPEARTIRVLARGLCERTLAAIARTWPDDPDDWWLSPQLEPCRRPESLTANLLASYTNYRYWPELLSSGLLPAPLANRVVDARLRGGGQFCGMTRFGDHLDDWPLADYLYGVWRLGRRDDFLLSLYGHVCYHQAETHLTAYEQAMFPPGLGPQRPHAPYCLPCQLVATRTARLLMKTQREA